MPYISMKRWLRCHFRVQLFKNSPHGSNDHKEDFSEIQSPTGFYCFCGGIEYYMCNSSADIAAAVWVVELWHRNVCYMCNLSAIQ